MSEDAHLEARWIQDCWSSSRGWQSGWLIFYVDADGETYCPEGNWFPRLQHCVGIFETADQAKSAMAEVSPAMVHFVR